MSWEHGTYISWERTNEDFVWVLHMFATTLVGGTYGLQGALLISKLTLSTRTVNDEHLFCLPSHLLVQLDV